MNDKLARSNEQTADSTAEPPAAPTAEATSASAEINANGHLLPHNWKGTIALIWVGASRLHPCDLAPPPSPRSGTSPPPKTRRSCLLRQAWQRFFPPPCSPLSAALLPIGSTANTS